MRRPRLELAVAINRLVRQEDERFDEPDEFDRLERALDAIGGIDDPNDREFGALLVRAASGLDVEAEMVELLRLRHC